MSPFLDPTRWIARSDFSAVLLDGYPVSLGHSLVVPLREVSKLDELSSAEIFDLFKLVRDHQRTLTALYRPDGFNIGINEGKAAGQTVQHLHVHIIPRYAGDHPNPRGGVRAVIPEKADYTS